MARRAKIKRVFDVSERGDRSILSVKKKSLLRVALSAFLIVPALVVCVIGLIAMEKAPLFFPSALAATGLLIWFGAAQSRRRIIFDSEGVQAKNVKYGFEDISSFGWENLYKDEFTTDQKKMLMMEYGYGVYIDFGEKRKFLVAGLTESQCRQVWDAFERLFIVHSRSAGDA